MECGKLLQRKEYRIKILNTINFSRSMHYNPFAYIHSEKDILKLVTALIANTKGEGKSGEDFWVKCETLLYTALIGYLHYVAPPEEQNFATLVDFINAMETRENEEDFQNPVDLMFDALAKKDPQHFAVRQYKKYKLAAGEATQEDVFSSQFPPLSCWQKRALAAPALSCYNRIIARAFSICKSYFQKIPIFTLKRMNMSLIAYCERGLNHACSL